MTLAFLETLEGNFREAMNVISYYERISRAKLSLEKSTIIQPDDQLEPEWLHHVGCKVAARDEVVVYLCYPIGANLLPSQEVEFLVAKVRKWL